MTARTSETIRVMLVEDDPQIRNALAMLLDAADGFELAGEASHGGEALALYAATRPDVVLMDIQMPVLDGISATRQILARDPQARILALTAFSSEQYVIPALRAGTAGYLLKDASPREILEAIRQVRRGEAVLSGPVTRELIASIRADEPASPPSTAEDLGLTPREVAVLEALALGLSNRDIAIRLFVSEASVKGALSRLGTKFGVRDRVQLLIHAVRAGLVEVS